MTADFGRATTVRVTSDSRTVRRLPRVARAPVAAAALACLAVACSALLDADVVQCRGDSDCAGRGLQDGRCVRNVCVVGVDASGPDVPVDASPVDPKWACLGHVRWGTQDDNARVLVRRRFRRLLGGGPLGQLTVVACGRLDPSCTAPIASGATDDSGYVNLTVPRFFEGVLSVEAPVTFASMMPSLVTLIPPPETDDDPTASGPSSLDVDVVSRGELEALVREVGTSLDPALAVVFGLALDCEGNVTSGVSFRLDFRDKKTLGYYTDDLGTPSISAQSTARRGEGGFLNAPVGAVTVEATVTALGKRLGRYTVFAKAGHISYLRMTPGPSL